MATLFTGGGGWEAAGVKLGLSPIWGVELDPTVADHYESIFGKHIIREDAMKVDYSSLSVPALLASSPPCQPTSASGKQARQKKTTKANDEFCDPDAGLATVMAAKVLRPLFVFVENSPNYINSNVFGKIKGGLEGLGYNTVAAVLDAANYGVASGRKRTILIAARKNILILPQWPEMQPMVSWYDVIADLIPSMKPTTLADWQRQALTDNPPPSHTPLLIAGGNPNRNARGYYVHRTPDQPAWTTQKTKNTSGMRVIDEAGVVRLMSTRGIARLQGFSDSYRLPENRALAIHILGNSIPPKFAEALLGQL